MLFVGKCVIIGLINLSHEKTGPENMLALSKREITQKIGWKTIKREKLICIRESVVLNPILYIMRTDWR